jgi:hypothetical protein
MRIENLQGDFRYIGFRLLQKRNDNFVPVISLKDKIHNCLNFQCIMRGMSLALLYLISREVQENFRSIPPTHRLIQPVQ